MNAKIKRTLVRAVVDIVKKDIDDTTTTCIGAYDALVKLTKKDLWIKSSKFNQFEKLDIDSQSDVEDMENIWAEMIQDEASYYYPDWKMI